MDGRRGDERDRLRNREIGFLGKSAGKLSAYGDRKEDQSGYSKLFAMKFLLKTIQQLRHVFEVFHGGCFP